MKIIALTGSVSGRKTPVVLNVVLDSLRRNYDDLDIELIAIGDYNLEFSDGRLINQYNLDTQFVINKILEADTIILGTPTYQTSIPGSLKNIFDLLPMKSLSDKVAGIIVTAGSPKYFLMAEQQLKPILSYMGCHIVQKYVFIEDCCFDGLDIIDKDIIERLERLGEDLIVYSSHLQWQKSSRFINGE